MSDFLFFAVNFTLRQFCPAQIEPEMHIDSLQWIETHQGNVSAWFM